MLIKVTSKYPKEVISVMTSLRLLFIFLKFHSCLSIGLYTGVPCHRPYNCIFEDNQDGFDNSLLLASYDNIEREKDCQGMQFSSCNLSK